MLIPNTIFRVGGAAMLLSNKRKDSWCVTLAVWGSGLHMQQLGV